jgi:GNAT superfamily N-acetyltransferase
MSIFKRAKLINVMAARPLNKPDLGKMAERVRRLDIKKEHPYGKPMLVYETPKREGGELFLLRDNKQHHRRISVLLFDPLDKSEHEAGSSLYCDWRGAIRIHGLGTEPEFRKREIAGSIIAYIRNANKGKDIVVNSKSNTVKVYQRLGFEMISEGHPLYSSMDALLGYHPMMLPKDKELEKGPFEKTRRFAVFPRKG